MAETNPSPTKIKIMTGGQTGVDRAALDAALKTGTACGGWCPKGRQAEDGTIPARYPVTELEGAGYKERTRQNVLDSDGTVIIYFGNLFGGSRETLQLCRQMDKPYLLIDAAEQSQEQAVDSLYEFMAGNAIGVLNVAGPRTSEESLAYGITLEIMTRFLGTLR